MKPINTYALTRVMDAKQLRLFERHLSGRSHYLNIKTWETESLLKMTSHLCDVSKEAVSLRFFYSFQIPKLGKEFDLLRISDDVVLNVELKTGNVTEAAVKKQLLLNRYYLASLGRQIHSYTYVSDEERLYRLTGSERLVETSWEKLWSDISEMGPAYEGDIEDLFLEENYLLSPLTDPDRFLRGDYFLTSQQKDIRRQILGGIEQKDGLFFGFTGLPGTGKTLLLYDLAMELSRRDRVIVLHYGSFPEELKRLNAILKRIDFVFGGDFEKGTGGLTDRTAILVDEGHRMGEEDIAAISDAAERLRVPVIFSYDREDAISEKERESDISERIENLPGYKGFKLTNRIRTNRELAAFIRSLMRFASSGRAENYPSVFVCYANCSAEADRLLAEYEREGFIPIREEALTTCREFERVVMTMDENFYYDEEGYLRCHSSAEGTYMVKRLYHGLSRAKTQIGLIVLNNPEVFQRILQILQEENEQ